MKRLVNLWLGRLRESGRMRSITKQLNYVPYVRPLRSYVLFRGISIFMLSAMVCLFIAPVLGSQEIKDFERKYEEQQKIIKREAEERVRREREWQRNLKTVRGYSPKLHAYLAEMLKLFDTDGEARALEYGWNRGVISTVDRKIEVVLEPEYGLIGRREIDLNKIREIENVEISERSVLGMVAKISLAGIKKISEEIEDVSFIRPFIKGSDHRGLYINCFSNEGKERKGPLDVVRWVHPLYKYTGTYVKGQIRVQFSMALVSEACLEVAESYGFHILCEYIPKDSYAVNIYLLNIPQGRDLTEMIEQLMHDPYIDFFYLEPVVSINPIQKNRRPSHFVE